MPKRTSNKSTAMRWCSIVVENPQISNDPSDESSSEDVELVDVPSFSVLPPSHHLRLTSQTKTNSDELLEIAQASLSKVTTITTHTKTSFPQQAKVPSPVVTEKPIEIKSKTKNEIKETKKEIKKNPQATKQVAKEEKPTPTETITTNLETKKPTQKRFSFGFRPIQRASQEKLSPPSKQLTPPSQQNTEEKVEGEESTHSSVTPPKGSHSPLLERSPIMNGSPIMEISDEEEEDKFDTTRPSPTKSTVTTGNEKIVTSSTKRNQSSRKQNQANSTIDLSAATTITPGTQSVIVTPSISPPKQKSILSFFGPKINQSNPKPSNNSANNNNNNRNVNSKVNKNNNNNNVGKVKNVNNNNVSNTKSPAKRKATNDIAPAAKKRKTSKILLQFENHEDDEDGEHTTAVSTTTTKAIVTATKKQASKKRRNTCGEDQFDDTQVKIKQCAVDFEIASVETLFVTISGLKKRKRRSVATEGDTPASKRSLSEVKQVESIIKAVPLSRYETQVKKWIVPLFYHDELKRTLTARGVTVSGVPRSILEIFKNRGKNEETKQQQTVDLSGIPPDLLKSLYKFQLQGVVFALQKMGRCIIGDEMGLGKTIQGIAIAACYKAEWPVLVICPSSVRMSWAAEFIKWLNLCPLDVNVIMTGKGSFDAQINIVSYNLVDPMLEQINKKQFNIVIADESHYLKDRLAKRTKAILPVLSNAKRVILLSGTPALSRPEELYTQLCAVQPSIFPKFEPFAVRYCNGHKGVWGWDTSGASRLTELHCIITETAMIRRKKAAVLHELPTKQRHTINIDVDVGEELQDQLSELRQLEHTIHKFGNTDKGRNAKRDKQKLTAIMYVETARTKIPAVQQYVNNILKESKEKFIIFAHHQEMMNGIEETIQANKVGFIRIDGSTKGEIRQQLVDQFQRKTGGCQVALLSVTAGGLGITLNAASSVIFAELYWTPAILLQAEDRAHRIGQLHPVNVFYLLGKGTLDDSIWPLVSRKLDIIGKAVDGENDQNMGAIAVDRSSLQYCAITSTGQDGDVDENEDVFDEAYSLSPDMMDTVKDNNSNDEVEEEFDCDLIYHSPPFNYDSVPSQPAGLRQYKQQPAISLIDSDSDIDEPERVTKEDLAKRKNAFLSSCDIDEISNE